MTLLETAIALAESGVRVFPLVPKAKNPISPRGVKDATTDLNSINTWWKKWPDANIGIAMGKDSGILGLDIDYKDGADKDFLKKIPPTIIAVTALGGNHAFFKYDARIKNGLKLEKGVTVRSDGYYFVGAGSTYVFQEKDFKESGNFIPEGKTSGDYKFYQNGHGSKFCLWDGEIAELPDWIIELSTNTKKEPFKLPENINKGEQHVTLFKQGCSLRAQGFSFNEILAAFVVSNGRLQDPAPLKNLEELAADICSRYEQGNKQAATNIPEEIKTNQKLDYEKIIYGSYPDERPMSKGKGVRRLGTIANLKCLLDRLGIVVRYNTINKKEEILIPDGIYTVDNKGNATIAYITDWCERVQIPTGNLKNYLTAIADSNLYNPVATWIESKPWDGFSRFKDFCKTVKSTNEELKEILFRKWLISCVAAAYEPSGVSAHGVLVFQGAQYMGKTRWFKKLAPESLGVLKDGLFLKPDDKDSVFLAVSNWIVELGELDATFRKADIAQLKAFLPKQEDVLRRPFAPTESHFARRTVFFGSVNEKSFLSDPTGNRRFWTVECRDIDHTHKVDMQQLWGEVLSWYRGGASWFLTTEEMRLLNSNNEEFVGVEPLEEKILQHYNWDNAETGEWKTSSAVCKDIGYDTPNSRDFRIVCGVLRKKTTRDEKKVDGVRMFYIPYPKQHF